MSTMIRNSFAILLFALRCSFSLAQDQDKAQPAPQLTDKEQKAQGKAQAEAALSSAGCGPSDIRFDVKADRYLHPSAQPEAGKAMVYVFEEDLTSNNIPTLRIALDSEWMGATTSSTYIFFTVDAGEHRLCTNWQENAASYARLGAALNFTAEPDRTYYFQAKATTIRDFVVHITLDPVNNAEGQFLIAGDTVSHFAIRMPEP